MEPWIVEYIKKQSGRRIERGLVIVLAENEEYAIKQVMNTCARKLIDSSSHEAHKLNPLVESVGFKLVSTEKTKEDKTPEPSVTKEDEEKKQEQVKGKTGLNLG